MDKLAQRGLAALAIGALGCGADPSRSVSDAAAPVAMLEDAAAALDASSETTEALIDHAAWRALPIEVDPFWDAEPDYRACGVADWLIEGDVEPYLELQTGACNYATLVQPSLAAVARGDVIMLALSHTSLNGIEAVGRAAILLGSSELWSRPVPIRAEPESHNIEWTAPEAFPAGTQITFHVENHGENAWRLLHLARAAR